MSWCLMTFLPLLLDQKNQCATNRRILTPSAETGVEVLATAKQLAGRRFGIRRLAEKTARLNRLVEVVPGTPLA